jgi:hypothetical protein
LIAPPPEPPDVAATPLPNLFLLLSETKSVTATQYHNIAAYRLFPSTFQVFDQMSYYILIAQLIDLATLHDIPNLVEITSMSSNIKHVMGFAYFYYGSGSNPQDQAPKFEFDQFLGNLCMGAKLLSTNWQAELCLQEQANTSKINGIFYYLNKIESNLQQVQELEIEIQKVHIWSYLNVLFLDDYGSVLVDRQGYFDRCVRLIDGVAFPSNMMVMAKIYGFLLPMAMSYVDLLVEANFNSGKKWLIDVYNSPTWKSCLAPLYDTYHHLTINFLLISRHTKLLIVFYRKMIYNGGFYALKVLSKWKDWFSKHGSYSNTSLGTAPMIIMHFNCRSLNWFLKIFNTMVNRDTNYWRAFMSPYLKVNYFKGVCSLESIPICLGITTCQATCFAVVLKFECKKYSVVAVWHGKGALIANHSISCLQLWFMSTEEVFLILKLCSNGWTCLLSMVLGNLLLLKFSLLFMSYFLHGTIYSTEILLLRNTHQLGHLCWFLTGLLL